MRPKWEKRRLGDTKDVRTIFGQAVVFPAARAVPGTLALGPQVLTRKPEVPATRRMGPRSVALCGFPATWRRTWSAG